MEAEGTALAGVVLCGGSSRRMGWDKAALEIGGSTLLERAVDRLATVAAPVILAAGARPLSHPGCISVADAEPSRGPLSGLVAALRAAPHRLCAAVAVDMPDLDPGLLRRLAALWDGEDAVVPVSPRGPEPLHAVYARSALTSAEAALQGADASLHGWLDALRVRWVDASTLIGAAAAARFAVNLNSPEAVTAWRRDRESEDPPPPGGLR